MGRVQVALASLLAALALSGGAYVKGRSDGRAVEVAQRATLEEVARVSREAAIMAAAEAVAQISVRHTTINKQAEVITREVPVYVDCRNDDRVIRLLDDARTGSGAVAPGGGLVP